MSNNSHSESFTPSNQTILSSLDYYIQSPSLIDFLKTKSTWEKLTQFLSYYTSGNKNDAIPEKKLAYKYPLTKSTRDLITQISSLLDTSKQIAFNLISDCFLQNQKMARNFIYLENLSLQPNNTDKAATFQSFLSDVTEEVINFYFNERLTLIDIIMRLLDTTYTQLDAYSENIRKITNELIHEHKLLNTIWKQFVSYKDKPIRNVMNNVIDEDQKFQILKEQKKMLDCMIIICNTNENCNKETFQQMLTYFSKTYFTCYYLEKFDNKLFDYHQNELEDLTESIVEKSVLLTIVNFLPSFLYDIIINNNSEQQIKNNINANPMDIPFDYYLPFLKENKENGLRNENYFTIQFTIRAMYSVVEILQQRGSSLSTEAKNGLTKYQTYKQGHNEEDAINYLKNMLNRYTMNNNSHNSAQYFAYFSNYYKFILTKWVNLIMATIYKQDIKLYPKSLISLTAMVLDSPLTRDDFFYKEKTNNSLIYKLFISLKENDYSSMNFLNFCFSLSESKKRSEYNEELLTLLTRIPENSNNDNDYIQRPFFADIFEIWEKMNDNLNNNYQFDITDNESKYADGRTTSLNEQIQIVRLFLKLYSKVNNSDEIIIAMQTEYNNLNPNYREKNIDTHYLTLLRLIIQSLTIFISNRNFYQNNINIIIELYNTLIEIFNKTQNDLHHKLTQDHCEKLCNIIFNSISYDFTIKDYTITVKAFKLIKAILSFENILPFLQINNKLFITNIFSFVINAINTFNTKTSFEHISEIKLIKELSQILNQLYTILISNSNRTPVYSKSAISLNNSSNINMIFNFICSLLNQIDMSEFLLNYLRIKVKIDSSQTSTKNRYHFINIFLDKSNIISINKIKKMLCEILKCLNSIYDLLLLYKMTSDKNIYELNVVKKWNYSLFISRTIPSSSSDSSNIMCIYDINLIMLLFIYTNFEFEHNLPMNPIENDVYFDDIASGFKLNIKQELNIENILYGKFISDTHINVSTLAYSALSRLVYLFQIENKEKRNVNIMNYICIKKSANSEIEGVVKMVDTVKENIIKQLLQEIPFLTNEILKFLCICTTTNQINFISFILEDFSYQSVDEKTIWEVIDYALPQLDYNSIEDDSIINTYGYTILFISKILNKDILAKKTLKNFFKEKKRVVFLQKVIKDGLQLFRISQDKINKIQNQIDLLCNNFTHQIEHYIHLLNMNQNINNICFNYILIQNMCFIYKRLITYNDFKLNSNNDIVFDMYFHDFIFNQLLKVINNYTYILNQNENPIVSFNSEANSIFQNGTTSYSILIQTNPLNMQFNLNNENILLSDHNNLFNYGYSYYIDLKELYLNCLLNDNYLELFDKRINELIRYNLILSLFEAKTQAMYGCSYLMGLIFTIGPCGYSMSTNFYTGVKVYESLLGNKEIVSGNNIKEDVMKVIDVFGNESFSNGSKRLSTKLGFNVMKLFNDKEKDLMCFVNDEIINHLVLDIRRFINFENMNINMNNKHINNVYTNYANGNLDLISLNYNILNYVLDYMLYNLKLNPKILLSQQDLLSILHIISMEFENFVSLSSNNNSTLIISITTSIYSILNYLLISKFNFEGKNLISNINHLMNSLIIYYNKEQTYRAIITYIFNTYSFLISNPNDNIIFNSFIYQTSSSSNPNFIISVISKFNENISEIEYQSFIMLLINLINKNPHHTFELILREKIFHFLKIANNFNNINEYEKNERSNKHILWCWNLKFISTVIMTFNSFSINDQGKYYQVYQSVLNHFKFNEERVMNVLTNCDYVDNNKNKVFKSLAFIEEVDMICEVIASIAIYVSKKGYDINNEESYLCWKYIWMLLDKTIMLFLPNMTVSKLYKSYSSVEKKMEEFVIKRNGVDINSNGVVNRNSNQLNNDYENGRNHLISNNNTNITNANNIQLRLNGGYTLVNNENIPYYNNSNINNNNNNNNILNNNNDIIAIVASNDKSNINNLFSFRIEQLLNHTLFNISTSIRLLLKNNYNSYVNFIENSIQNKNDYVFLNTQAKNIMNSFYFAIHLLENMVQMNKIYQLMYNKAQLFYDNIEIGTRFGFFNLICRPIENKDMFRLNNYIVHNLLHISVTINDCFKLFNLKMEQGFEMEEQFKEMIVKPLQGVKHRMKERDQIINEMKGCSENFSTLIEWVKHNMEE